MKLTVSGGIQTNKPALQFSMVCVGIGEAWLPCEHIGGHFTQSGGSEKVYKLRHKGWITITQPKNGEEV